MKRKVQEADVKVLPQKVFRIASLEAETGILVPSPPYL
jgi:hypothetical protein